MNRRKFVMGCAGLGALSVASEGAWAAAGGSHARPGAVLDDFNQPRGTDHWLDEQRQRLLRGVLRRLTSVQRTVGFGNFGVLCFDEMIKTARGYTSIGGFSAAELAFLEQIFFAEARDYGFMGRKVLQQLTDNPRNRKMRSIPGSGHRLFQGEALRFYTRMRKDVGPDLVLTSGVRGVVKQFHLFLRKAESAHGNLSLASRSLAPPGYSFHGIGDFDVGLRGFGRRNFTAAFAETTVFKRLLELGYVTLRYPMGNRLGVRYEPWHMRVLS